MFFKDCIAVHVRQRMDHVIHLVYIQCYINFNKSSQISISVGIRSISQLLILRVNSVQVACE